jgi:hypothetical protein
MCSDVKKENKEIKIVAIDGTPKNHSRETCFEGL